MALSQRDKRLLLIPVGLAGVLAFYNWIHEPLFARRAEASAQHEQVAMDLQRDKNRLAREGNVKARKEAVAAREKVIDAWVPGKNSAALFIWYLSQAEMQSGARIQELKVTERKQVQGKPGEGAGAQSGKTGAKAAPSGTQAAQSGTQAAQAAAQPDQSNAQAQAPSNQNPNATPAAPPAGDMAPTLTVIQLELKVEARFAQHLLFNQAMEEMPLFLNTDQLSIERDDQSAFAKAETLVKDGNAWLAAKMLQSSPELGGTYLINLYFKGDKVGPTTEPMQFATQTGKADPFVRDGVDEFLKTLVDYYNQQRAEEKGNGGTAPPAQQGSPAEQMG